MLLVSPTGVSGTAVDEYDWRAGSDLRFLIVDAVESLKPTADQRGGSWDQPFRYDAT